MLHSLEGGGELEREGKGKGKEGEIVNGTIQSNIQISGKGNNRKRMGKIGKGTRKGEVRNEGKRKGGGGEEERGT